jgi:hypothetical protein
MSRTACSSFLSLVSNWGPPDSLVLLAAASNIQVSRGVKKMTSLLASRVRNGKQFLKKRYNLSLLASTNRSPSIWYSPLVTLSMGSSSPSSELAMKAVLSQQCTTTTSMTTGNCNFCHLLSCRLVSSRASNRKHVITPHSRVQREFLPP